MEEKWKKVNPVLPLDYPDPDVIRVDDTYYMVSTTMHFMPGCVILRSYNLADWEIYSYVYETLEITDQECLKNGKNAYGQGMWAATLRYEKGMFYLEHMEEEINFINFQLDNYEISACTYSDKVDIINWDYNKLIEEINKLSVVF